MQSYRLFALNDANELTAVGCSPHGRLLFNAIPFNCAVDVPPTSTILHLSTPPFCEFFPSEFTTAAMTSDDHTITVDGTTNIIVQRTTSQRVTLRVYLPQTPTDYSGCYLLIDQASELFLNEYVGTTTALPDGYFRRLPETEVLIYPAANSCVMVSGYPQDTYTTSVLRLFFYNYFFNNSYPSDAVQPNDVYVRCLIPPPLQLIYKNVRNNTHIWAITILS